MSFPVSALIKYSSSTFISVLTNNPGNVFVALPSTACIAVQIDNTDATKADIEIQKGGAGYTIKIPAGGSRYFSGITNANQLAVRRLDTSSVQVSISGEAIVQ